MCLVPVRERSRSGRVGEDDAEVSASGCSFELECEAIREVLITNGPPVLVSHKQRNTNHDRQLAIAPLNLGLFHNGDTNKCFCAVTVT